MVKARVHAACKWENWRLANPWVQSDYRMVSGWILNNLCMTLSDRTQDRSKSARGGRALRSACLDGRRRAQERGESRTAFGLARPPF